MPHLKEICNILLSHCTHTDTHTLTSPLKSYSSLASCLSVTHCFKLSDINIMRLKLCEEPGLYSHLFCAKSHYRHRRDGHFLSLLLAIVFAELLLADGIDLA